uniref:Uncharacterized protein n=1 Tax=Salix viminalis TaxID=40686 RepID=A0A6N2NJI0_SALVM
MVVGKTLQSYCQMQDKWTHQPQAEHLSRSTNQGRLGAHWTYPGSAAIMSCEKNWLRCLELRGNWKTLIDQAGSLYLSTGRMMCFSLEMIPGSYL